ncbi:hypothetical protein [Ekhidna sp.]|uniref:hypothetical protein n=1 Tax=Ekhidna sp. TaxID=2608089 RepID=UPI003BAB0B43
MLAKLIIDFGLVILIWMTQLVVYPSFTYFAENDLFRWHSKYTTAVSIIVMPLMLGQLGIHGYSLYNEFSWLKSIALLLIVLTWINTFFFAVPLHNNIGEGKEVLTAAKSLVNVNWYRTVLWTGIFLLSLYEYLKTP